MSADTGTMRFRERGLLMLKFHRSLAVLTSLFGVGILVLPALAAPSVVTVTLNNKPIAAALPGDLGMEMPGADMSKAVMSITASPNTVPAGEVTFVATNKSSDFTHEMVVVRMTDPHRPLPYVTADNKVNEDAAGHLGEVSELDPGKSGSLSLTLTPGTYMLFCNVAGHYMAGMWTTITVQ
jgi:uncharacterized cupredoxin-like copper-binding protein